MYLTPPDTQNIKKKIWGPPEFFENRTRSPLVSVSAVLGNEYPVLENEYQKWSGISRVKSAFTKTII